MCTFWNTPTRSECSIFVGKQETHCSVSFAIYIFDYCFFLLNYVMSGLKICKIINITLCKFDYQIILSQIIKNLDK